MRPVIYDDTTPEVVSDNDRGHLRMALHWAREAVVRTDETFYIQATRCLSLAWLHLSDCDDIGPAWRAAMEQVANYQAEVLAKIRTP